MKIILNHFTHHPLALHLSARLSHQAHHHPHCHPQAHQNNIEQLPESWSKKNTRYYPTRRCVPKL